MLVLRLQRKGKKHEPFFRIVAADSRRHVTKKILGNLGFFNPKTKELKFDEKQIKTLLDKGAQMSNRVKRLLQEQIKDMRIKAINRPERKPRKKKKSEALTKQPSTGNEMSENSPEQEDTQSQESTSPDKALKEQVSES